jgi:hypothetical protein
MLGPGEWKERAQLENLLDIAIDRFATENDPKTRTQLQQKLLSLMERLEQIEKPE